nr:DNA ligase 1-like [Coffea arabica]
MFKLEEHQTEEHPISDSEEELEQPTNAYAFVTKSPRNVTKSHSKKGKRSAKRKGIAQTKERQTADPSVEQSEKQQAAEKNIGEQQTAESSTRKSPRTSDSEEELEQPINTDASVTKSPRNVTKSHSKKGKRSAKRNGIAQTKERQTADPSVEQSEKQQAAEKNVGDGKRKRPAKEQREAQTAEEPIPLPKFIDNVVRERKSTIKSFSSNSEVISLFENLKQHILLLENGLMMTMSSEQQATFINKRNLLVPPIPQDNVNAHQKEPRTKPTTETIPEYHASNSQPQDKRKAPATEEETEEDDDEDTEEEEVDPAQFRLTRRRPGSSKITI